jgi:hypothetical protein
MNKLSLIGLTIAPRCCAQQDRFRFSQINIVDNSARYVDQ